MKLKRYLLSGMAIFIIALLVSCVALFIFSRDSGFEINYLSLLFTGAIGLVAGLIIVGPFILADW